MPSVNLTEAEPNNSPATANAIARMPETQVLVSGSVGGLGDRDWFRLQLQPGDVVGTAVTGRDGLNPALRLVDAAGTLLVANDDANGSGHTHLPRESPLPAARRAETDAEVYYVISTAGMYFLEVSASGDAGVGKYDLDTMVARPGMESRPAGAKQILYLDFDGATVNFNKFAGNPIRGGRTLIPLAAVLPDWGLTAADLNAVIDGVVSQVTDKLFTYVRANGLNPTTGVEIWNSRDHADPGNDPLVSRIVVGGKGGEPGFDPGTGGIAQDIDVGNFKTDDMAVVLGDIITSALQLIPIQAPATVRDFAVAGIADLVAHEAGHILGCFHTEQDEADPTAGIPNLMDHAASWHSVGPDHVFGTADDGDVQFGVDEYSSADPYRGRNDTLNTVAFGLSTGQQTSACAPGMAAPGTPDGPSVARPSDADAGPGGRRAAADVQDLPADGDPLTPHGVDVRDMSWPGLQPVHWKKRDHVGWWQ
ncbi:MAG TPA: hypothetical protein VGF55_17015 [Gemmataceae bacterium]|jgi:hypothetical protein